MDRVADLVRLPCTTLRLGVAAALLATTACARSAAAPPAAAPPAAAPPATAAPAPPPASRPTCTSPEHHQFDFWLGEWEVRAADGRLLGTSRIEGVLDGCALVEHWSGAGPGRGTSLNFYDRASGQWSQTWIDNAGQPLHLAGGLRDGAMVLEGTAPTGPGGQSGRQRVTWRPLPEGAVRQTWERSIDDGATWTVVFDGRYTPHRP